MARILCFEKNWASLSTGSIHALSDAEAKHVSTVLRASIGDSVRVLNGQGTVFQTHIKSITKKEVLLHIDSIQSLKKPTPRLTLLQSLPKGKIMDDIVRKATEIGVDTIIPLITQRTEVHLDNEKALSKQKRWIDIATEACKQSNNAWLPNITPITCFSKALNTIAANHDYKIVASLDPLATVWSGFNNDSFESILYCVGPEGDFTPQEYADLKNLGFFSMQLTQTILRVETAAIYGLSVLSYALKNQS